MRGRLWTDKEDRIAQDLLRKGLSANYIAKKVGHSSGAVWSRNYLQWNIPNEHVWSDEDDLKLRAMWEAGKSIDEMRAILDRTPAAILARKKPWKLERRDRKHPKTNPDFFRTLTPQSAYVLGFFITDGNVSGHTRIVNGYSCPVYKAKLTQAGVCGYKLLRDIQKVSGGALNGPYIPKKIKKDIPKEQWILTWNGKEIIEVLAGYGIGPRKSFTVELPTISNEVFSHFFRGVVDGDGCITHDGHGYPFLQIVSASEKFIMQLKAKLISVVDIKCPVYRRVRKSPASDKQCVYYTLSFSTISTKKVLDWMYFNKEQSFWLYRKWETYQKLLKQQRKSLESI